MPALETPKNNNNFKMIDFNLPGADGRMHSLAACAGPRGTLVMFICNHCPYVKAVIDRLADDCRHLAAHGIGAVAIMPNDTAAYPADSLDNMKVFARTHALPFPYLIDETQETARAYAAICTPDIFGFNADGMLRYRGRIDSAGPKEAGPETVRELRAAMLLIAATGDGPAEQFPSIGCSVKWRA